MLKYETYENDFGQTFVKATNEAGQEFYIPSDPANSDYQRYLKWLEDPTAADQPIGGNIK